MSLDISVVTNCDDAVIFWRVDEVIKNCFGFAIERERKLANGGVERKTLDNRTGFKKDHPKSGDFRPSNLWPFQRFWWADHSVNSGDRVRYRATPMIYEAGELNEQIDGQSRWTPWVDLTGDAGDGISSYFNRGLVISQFMARYLEDLRKKKALDTREEAIAEFKRSLDVHELPIRHFLSGELRVRMLRLLKDAKDKKRDVYGALYELEDGELIAALAALRKRGHVVLANGSITAKKGEGVEKARKRDQNAVARKKLKAAGLEVQDRFISPGALGHNKFLVFNNEQGKPASVWTGSTNWTKTGLCTQINNGVLIQHAGFAKIYQQQWERLRDAKNAFPKTLVAENSTAKKVSVGKTRADIWFTRASKKVDLQTIDAVINNAQEAVLFLMFQPGGAGNLATVRKLLRAKSKTHYIKGVVSTLPSEDPQNEEHVDVSVHSDGEIHRVDLDIVQPEGIKRPFSSWAATVVRREFMPQFIKGGRRGGIGNAIVHSKLIVVDPFTRPVVVTGSHNFSLNASKANDENFVIFRGNQELALDYAAHILSVYHHYRWMAYVNEMQAKHQNPKAHLRENDTWQAWQLKGAPRRELDFWLR